LLRERELLQQTQTVDDARTTNLLSHRDHMLAREFQVRLQYELIDCHHNSFFCCSLAEGDYYLVTFKLPGSGVVNT
jgi:hypothetical protein